MAAPATVMRLAPLLCLLLCGCRSMAGYEPLLDPVSHLDLRLDPCPQSPNCVSSQAWNPDQRVAPFGFAGDAEEALDALAQLVEADPAARVVERSGIYLHAEYQSGIFRFIDDLELLADDEAGVVHVRSGSRRGWSDLGENRRRVESLRASLAQSMLPLQ